MPASGSQMVLNYIHSHLLTTFSPPFIFSPLDQDSVVSLSVTPHWVGQDCGDREGVCRGGTAWESAPGITLGKELAQPIHHGMMTLGTLDFEDPEVQSEKELSAATQH